jgi:hypothetical protein
LASDLAAPPKATAMPAHLLPLLAPRSSREFKHETKSEEDSFEILPDLKTEVSLLKGALRGMFSGKRYTMNIGYTPTISTNGSGIVNAVIACASIGTLTEWPAFQQLFDEFFIVSMHCRYMPVSRYQYPVASSPATLNTSFPMTSSSLFHGVGNYTNVAGAVNNPTTMWRSSSDPWTHRWINNENINSDVVVSSSTSSTAPTQGWCLTATSPSQNYSGTVQYLSGMGTLVASTVIAQLAVTFVVVLRNRA